MSIQITGMNMPAKGHSVTVTIHSEGTGAWAEVLYYDRYEGTKEPKEFPVFVLPDRDHPTNQKKVEKNPFLPTRITEDTKPLPASFDFSGLEAYDPTEIILCIKWISYDGNYVERVATAAAWFSDWCGEYEMCPPNEAEIISVTARATDGKPIANWREKIVFFKTPIVDYPYFENLMNAIRPTMVYHHWDSADEDYIEAPGIERSEPRIFIGKKSALAYIKQNDVPYAKAVGCLDVCPECGHPIFPSKNPSGWAYCYHCDTEFAKGDIWRE